MKKYWLYDFEKQWGQIERPPFSEDDWEDFLIDQGYHVSPDLVIGDEFDFLSIYEHPESEEFLFHFIIDEFAKVLYANSMPAMMHVMRELNALLSIYFKTCSILRGMESD